MSIIIGPETKVVVQGMTGNEGRFHTASMLEYGTKVVAGVRPGKGGQVIGGVPIYDTVAEAVTQQGANTSIIFVPPQSAASAADEAISAGIGVMVIITEGVPQKDEIKFIAQAQNRGVVVVGPNCPGLICPPERLKIGIMPSHIFVPGNVGMISRSGTLTYEVAWHITNAGLGQSTCVGIGGDPVVGLDFVTVLEMFREDEGTEKVVLIGEIGGSAEERAASYIIETKYPKSVVAYVAGRTAPSEKRMGHAGAIVMGNVGTAKSKIDAFKEAGVPVAEKPSDIPGLLSK